MWWHRAGDLADWRPETFRRRRNGQWTAQGRDPATDREVPMSSEGEDNDNEQDESLTKRPTKVS